MDYADQTCISNLQDMVDVIDNIFALNDDSKSQQLMDVFGLGNLTYVFPLREALTTSSHHD